MARIGDDEARLIEQVGEVLPEWRDLFDSPEEAAEALGIPDPWSGDDEYQSDLNFDEGDNV